MNNTEIEMVLQELLRDIQTIKSEIRQTSTSSKDGNENIVNRQLESILKEMGKLNDSVKTMAQKTSLDVPKIDYAPILRFEEKLKELERIQSLPPHVQIVSHEHSFKNWRWLIVLFLFMGLSVLFGWYALDNYYEAKGLKVKYEFVRKEVPEHIRQLDSVYQVKPEWVEKFLISKFNRTQGKKQNKDKKRFNK
ncbi:MAG: hypothetical protein DI598_10565 [Pseudopedobacter saltans]|uniref:Uncharacterized protein n=1 Tax=Pseudopedobacter saltans TaxID=151895 RepID=A0A2W5EV60_9SPHI|nr:MAG: hypothetical protein DI598_10565 [Pseudopedobacter saltans]